MLVHTDIPDHPTKRHFILCIICIYSKQIILMDPLADGHNLIDYASTFLAILNITKLIYSTCSILKFDEFEWKLYISTDCVEQLDGSNCGVFFSC